MNPDEGSWGVTPVPERLRTLSGFDTALLWSNLGISLLVIVAGSFLVPRSVSRRRSWRSSSAPFSATRSSASPASSARPAACPGWC